MGSEEDGRWRCQPNLTKIHPSQSGEAMYLETAFLANVVGTWVDRSNQSQKRKRAVVADEGI